MSKYTGMLLRNARELKNKGQSVEQRADSLEHILVMNDAKNAFLSLGASAASLALATPFYYILNTNSSIVNGLAYTGATGLDVCALAFLAKSTYHFGCMSYHKIYTFAHAVKR